MTTTLPPPPAPAPAPRATVADPPPPAPPRRTRRGPEPGSVEQVHLVLSEVALWGVTLAAIFGFGRIFDSWSFFAPLAVIATVGHLIAATCRRRGLGVPASFGLSAVAWVLVTTWLFFVETTMVLVPTLDTWSAASGELNQAWDEFQRIVAPAPTRPGFLLAGAAALGVGTFLADWAAYRLWSAREALVPSVTLFVFATLLADDRYRTISAVIEVGAILLFVLLHRMVTLERSEGWVDGGRRRAGWSLLRAGLAIGAVALLLGTLVAPHLPGVDEKALVDWRRNDDSDGARTLTSPLVDIRSRIVDTSNTLLFTVDSPTRSYWRIAALDRFNGVQWGFSGKTDQAADGELDTDDVARREGAEEVRQRFQLERVRTEWLPAAYRPVAFVPESDVKVRFDTETTTFIPDDEVGEGTTYEVTSALDDFTPDQLQSADARIPSDLRDQTELPDGFSQTAREIAQDVTADSATPYDKAMALQDYFRSSGEFTYSTDVQPGQGNDAIDAFLERKTGYCEQFAGTFAAMARSLGIPARVAVGYTWGEQDPSNPDEYRVLGRNAHAWPEVYLGQFGWVPFEPTPGRGNPDAESYTRVPPAQGTESAAPESTTTTTADGPTTTTTAPAPEVQPVAPETTSSGSDGGGRSSVLTLIGLLLVAAVIYAVAVPGIMALRRRRRRARAAASPTAQVGVAWTEAVDSLADAGVRARPDETHTELAARAGGLVPGAARPLGDLSRLADAAAYGTDATDADGVTAGALATDVRVAVDTTLGTGGRLRRMLDPRPLWDKRPRRHRTR